MSLLGTTEDGRRSRQSKIAVMPPSEKKPAVHLDSDFWNMLNTEDSKSINALTDELRNLGVGKAISPPHIVLIGERSAGKSSVLQAITRVRFPVSSDVGTKFATEFVLRRALETSVNISVRFADWGKEPKTLQRKGFRNEDLPAIIAEAGEFISDEVSEDVLRVEISGPELFPLTLVDLPGTYKDEQESQAGEEDATVDRLIERYMSKSNSILMPVFHGSCGDKSLHQTLRRIRKHHPGVGRILGIITKPDLALPDDSSETLYVRLAKNHEAGIKLHLGWHVLRNPAEDVANLETRDAKEAAFFKTGAWAFLPPADRGAISLRKKLCGILIKRMKSELGGMVGEVGVKLQDRNKELDRLGPVRSNPQQQRSFLLDVAQRYGSLAECGIDGRYHDPFFGNLDDSAHKLRAQLRNLNNAFDHVLAVQGSKLAIISPKDFSNSVPDVSEHLKPFIQMYSDKFLKPEPILLHDLHARLEKQACPNQGRDFAGAPSRDLVIQLFKHQSSPWKSIAAFHIQQVTLATKAFVDQVFQHLLGRPEQSHTMEGILRNYVDKFFEEKEALLDQKLLELLKPFERGYTMPQDWEFQRMMRQRTMDRLSSWLAATKVETSKDNRPTARSQITESLLTDAVLALEGPKQGQFGTGKVIDMMQSYYELSRRTFADNVIHLAVESCLVADLPDIFTSQKVAQMSDDELEALAGESEDTISRRQGLESEKMVLQQGLEACRKYKPRAVTAPFAMPKPMAAPFTATLPAAPHKVSPPETKPAQEQPRVETTNKSPFAHLLAPSDASTSSSESPKSTPESKASTPETQTKTPGGLFAITKQSAPVSGGLFGGSANGAKSTVQNTDPPVDFNKPLSGAKTIFGGPGGPKAKEKPSEGLFGSSSTSSEKKDADGAQQPKGGGLFDGPPPSWMVVPEKRTIPYQNQSTYSSKDLGLSGRLEETISHYTYPGCGIISGGYSPEEARLKFYQENQGSV